MRRNFLLINPGVIFELTKLAGESSPSNVVSARLSPLCRNVSRKTRRGRRPRRTSLCIFALNRSPNRLSGRSNSRGARLAGRRTTPPRVQHVHVARVQLSFCEHRSLARSLVRIAFFSLPLPLQQNSLYPLYNVERIMRTGNYGDCGRPLPPRMRSMLPFRYGDDDDSCRRHWSFLMLKVSTMTFDHDLGIS